MAIVVPGVNAYTKITADDPENREPVRDRTPGAQVPTFLGACVLLCHFCKVSAAAACTLSTVHACACVRAINVYSMITNHKRILIDTIF